MKKLYILLLGIILIGLSCTYSINLDVSKIQNSNWLYHDFGDCQEVYSFKDSTFTLNSCEVAETFAGDFWINNDTLYLLIPKPEKQKIVVGGDSVELNVQMLHYIRPTLEKIYYKNDTLFFLEIYDNYLEENQSKFTDFKIKYLTRLNN